MGFFFYGVGEELVLWGLFVGVESSYHLVFVSGLEGPEYWECREEGS